MQKFIMNIVLQQIQGLFIDGFLRAKYYIIFRLSIDFHDFWNAFRCSQAWVVNNTQACSYKGLNKVSLPFRSKIFAIENRNSYPRCGEQIHANGASATWAWQIKCTICYWSMCVLCIVNFTLCARKWQFAAIPNERCFIQCTMICHGWSF